MGVNWSRHRRANARKDKRALRQTTCSSSGPKHPPAAPSQAPPSSSSSGSSGHGNPRRMSSASASASASATDAASSPTAALKLGSITETWKNQSAWKRFAAHLDTMEEGRDSDGRAMSLGRYARFLQLYVRLDQAERIEGRPAGELQDLTLAIRQDPEDFFGTERCLRCIDKGMRRQVLENLKRVKKGEVKAGTWVYQPVYPRVLDKLNEMLGSYQSAELASG